MAADANADDLMEEDSPEQFVPFELPPRPQQGPAPGFRSLFEMLGGMLNQQQNGNAQPQPQQPPPPFQFFPMGGLNTNNFVFHANFGPMGGAPAPQAPFQNPLQFLQQLLNGGGIQMGDYVIGENIDNLLNQLFQQQGKNGPPPASKDAVSKLSSRTLSEAEAKHYDECAICKGNFVETDVVREMPCSHVYHPECIEKWLEQRNFCPMCRFELPTDDADYERLKAEKSQQQNGASTQPPQQQQQQQPQQQSSAAQHPFPPNLDVD